MIYIVALGLLFFITNIVSVYTKVTAKFCYFFKWFKRFYGIILLIVSLRLIVTENNYLYLIMSYIGFIIGILNIYEIATYRFYPKKANESVYDYLEDSISYYYSTLGMIGLSIFIISQF